MMYKNLNDYFQAEIENIDKIIRVLKDRSKATGAIGR